MFLYINQNDFNAHHTHLPLCSCPSSSAPHCCVNVTKPRLWLPNPWRKTRKDDGCHRSRGPEGLGPIYRRYI